MKQRKTRRRVLTILCIFIFVLFIMYCAFLFLRRDDPPVITINSNVDKYSVNMTQEDLMLGVTASDKEDGDVTDSIIIEGLSHFTDKEKHTRNVIYVAFDSAKNVTKVTREITYTDYKAPEITVEGDLVFSLGVSEAQVLDRLHCIDVIDGDISDQITLQQNNTLQTSRIGVQTLTFEVTNSCGDTALAALDIEITG